MSHRPAKFGDALPISQVVLDALSDDRAGEREPGVADARQCLDEIGCAQVVEAIPVVVIQGLASGFGCFARIASELIVPCEHGAVIGHPDPRAGRAQLRRTVRTASHPVSIQAVRLVGPFAAGDVLKHAPVGASESMNRDHHGPL